jgi:hypothetical protein
MVQSRCRPSVAVTDQTDLLSARLEQFNIFTFEPIRCSVLINQHAATVSMISNASDFPIWTGRVSIDLCVARNGEQVCVISERKIIT